MTEVRPKKHLGQHFLRDENIAKKIVDSLGEWAFPVLEVGPGMGVLTKHLLEGKNEVFVVEVDTESIAYLRKNYPALENHIIEADFLRLDFEDYFKGPFAVIGNFPYNISSQIVFKILEDRNKIPLMVGMFQKEVAERLAAKPRTKAYGILSVLTQAFYDIEYLFTVNENVFIPPPKVKSAVIRLKRNKTENLDCDEALFIKVVKAGFNQRRKTLRNALSQLTGPETDRQLPVFNQRAEELSVKEFVDLTNILDKA